MRTRSLAAIVIGLVLVTSPHPAEAGIVVDVQFVTRNFLPPDTALTGFASVQVDVHTDDGALISAVDVTFEGPLHQRWINPGDSGDCGFFGGCETPRGMAADGRGDSHLTLPSNALLGTFLFENNTVNGPLPDGGNYDYGIGDTLSGAWGIPGPSQTPTASIAYLVIPNGSSILFHWAIATTGTTGEAFLGSTIIPVPEPTAVTILLMSTLSLSTSRI